MALTKKEKEKVEKAKNLFNIFVAISAIIILSLVTVHRFKKTSFDSLGDGIREDLSISLEDMTLHNESDEIETFTIDDGNISIDLPSNWTQSPELDEMNSLVEGGSFEILFLAYDLSMNSIGSTFLSIQRVLTEETMTIDDVIGLLNSGYEEKGIIATTEIEDSLNNNYLVNVSLVSEETSINEAKEIISILDNKVYVTSLYSTKTIWQNKKDLFEEILLSLKIKELDNYNEESESSAENEDTTEEDIINE